MKNKYNELVVYVTENRKYFYKICYAYVKNEQDALDIIQTAIYKAISSYRSMKNDAIKSWFYRILVNECLSFLRKHKRYIVEEVSEAIEHNDTYNIYYENLYEHIEQLPLDIRTIIILRYFEDMKITDIAYITKMNVNTVKTKLYKGLKLLKVEMEDLYE